MLNPQIKTLEDTQAAILNILEDLEINRDKLHAEKIKDEAILESIGEGIIATDKDEKIILMNTQTELILGWGTKELLGKKIGEIVRLEDEKNQPLVLSSDKRQSIDCLFYHKNGKKIPIGLTIAPIIQGNQKTGAILIFRDITREKEIDRMKTEFISLASHQMRTPLTAIRWSSEMLLNKDTGTLTFDQDKLLRNIYLSTRRMIDLVNSLLNVSRIESGGIRSELQIVNVSRLVQEVVDELGVKLKEKKIDLHIDIDLQIPQIKVDPKLLRQVYLNLLCNAIEYTPVFGKIYLHVEKKEEELVSQVTDTGYGIPQEEQNKIFRKFYRGTNSMKIETDGSGLGLYMVKVVIDALKGKVWFKSEENKGTTFWFSIPITG